MTSRVKGLLWFLVVLAFAGLLLYNTLSAQRAECTVCVEFNGARNCATASHDTESAAKESAQSTACGVLAKGMDQTIACGNARPVSVQCRTR